MYPFMLAIMIGCFVLSINPAYAGELLTGAQKIVPTKTGQIPQAPRVSPDGQQLVFEYYTKNKTMLWQASSDGTSMSCLSCDMSIRVENGFWHPSGGYIIFNEGCISY